MTPPRKKAAGKKQPPKRPARKASTTQATSPLDRRARFVAAYLLEPNATKAARAAGYTDKNARSQGSRLLTNADIWRAIAEAREARAARVQVDQDRVVQELAAVGFADMADFLVLGPNGSVTFDWKHLPPGASRAIMELVVDEYTEGSGEAARPVRRTKLKLHPKIPALELLARHVGMLIHKHEHTGKDGGPIATTALTAEEREAALLKIMTAAAARVT